MLKNCVIRFRLFNATEEMKDRLSHAVAAYIGQGHHTIQYSIEDNGLFQFPHEHTSYAISYEEILYFEKHGHQVLLHTTRGDFFFYGSLSSLEERLDPYQFFRVHQGYIVNITKIRAYINYHLFLDPDDSRIPVSKRREKKVLEMLEHFHYIQRIFYY